MDTCFNNIKNAKGCFGELKMGPIIFNSSKQKIILQVVDAHTTVTHKTIPMFYYFK